MPDGRSACTTTDSATSAPSACSAPSPSTRRCSSSRGQGRRLAAAGQGRARRLRGADRIRERRQRRRGPAGRHVGDLRSRRRRDERRPGRRARRREVRRLRGPRGVQARHRPGVRRHPRLRHRRGGARRGQGAHLGSGRRPGPVRGRRDDEEVVTTRSTSSAKAGRWSSPECRTRRTSPCTCPARMARCSTEDDQGHALRVVQPAVRHHPAAAPLRRRAAQARRADHPRYTLDEINEGYQDLRDGKIIRGIIDFSK